MNIQYSYFKIKDSENSKIIAETMSTFEQIRIELLPLIFIPNVLFAKVTKLT